MLLVCNGQCCSHYHYILYACCNILACSNLSFLFFFVQGGGRNYIPLSYSGKSPLVDDGGGGEADGDNESTSNRPQLSVVIPGQKGFMSRTVSTTYDTCIIDNCTNFNEFCEGFLE